MVNRSQAWALYRTCLKSGLKYCPIDPTGLNWGFSQFRESTTTTNQPTNQQTNKPTNQQQEKCKNCKKNKDHKDTNVCRPPITLARRPLRGAMQIGPKCIRFGQGMFHKPRVRQDTIPGEAGQLNLPRRDGENSRKSCFYCQANLIWSPWGGWPDTTNGMTTNHQPPTTDNQQQQQRQRQRQRQTVKNYRHLKLH